MLVLNAHSTPVSFCNTSRIKVNILKTKTSNMLLKIIKYKWQHTPSVTSYEGHVAHTYCSSIEI